MLAIAVTLLALVITLLAPSHHLVSTVLSPSYHPIQVGGVDVANIQVKNEMNTFAPFQCAALPPHCYPPLTFAPFQCATRPLPRCYPPLTFAPFQCAALPPHCLLHAPYHAATSLLHAPYHAATRPLPCR